MDGSPAFSLFPDLPLELRRKIWFHALPGPRALMILPRTPQAPRTTLQRLLSSKPHDATNVSNYTVAPPSYGGYQPAILFVNRESRTEALYHLTPLFGTYWNLDIDTPYFEFPLKDNPTHEVKLIKEMREAGDLDLFKQIAIDWKVWEWIAVSATMEFQVTLGTLLPDKYEHLFATLNKLPNIKTCTFVHTDNFVRRDISKPYLPWYLGPFSFNKTLYRPWEVNEKDTWDEIKNRRCEIDATHAIEFRFMAIYDRERVTYHQPHKFDRTPSGGGID